MTHFRKKVIVKSNSHLNVKIIAKEIFKRKKNGDFPFAKYHFHQLLYYLRFQFTFTIKNICVPWWKQYWEFWPPVLSKCHRCCYLRQEFFLCGCVQTRNVVNSYYSTTIISCNTTLYLKISHNATSLQLAKHHIHLQNGHFSSPPTKPLWP